jgi:hypothetical protein
MGTAKNKDEAARIRKQQKPERMKVSDLPVKSK